MEIYLVTGGAGFIGSHIAHRLAVNGNSVRIVDNFSTGRRETASMLRDRHGSRLEVIEGDLRNPEVCRVAVKDCRAVFHEAALPSVQRSVENPLESHECNATSTLRLLQESLRAGVQRFVYAGSSSVYGDTPELPKSEDMPPNPRSPYALSKFAGEEYARIFQELHGFSTVTLRYFNVFGPRQDPHSAYAAVIPLFITALLRGEAPVIFGDGEQSRDFTYVDNVVDANLAAAERPDVTGVINIGCGEQTTLLQLLDMISETVGERCEPRFEPPRQGDVRHSRADITRAVRCLELEPRIGLHEGLVKTADALRESES